MRSRWISWSLAGLVLAAPSLQAQPSTSTEEARSPSGVVVRLEAGRLVVAMEHPALVVVGARMGLFRPVTVRHPVTHRTLTDRIPLGSVVIEHVGAELTTARAVGELADAARVGDVLAATSDTALAPSRETPPTETPAAPQRGDGYLRARIPQSYVTVGTIEYFVEFSRRDGQTSPLVGRAGEPRSVEVLSQPEGPPPAEGRSRIDLRGEIADVGTRTVGGVQRVQRFVTVEGDFLQRLNSSWLYGYRVGFGVYDGDAPSLSALSTPNPSVHTRVIYGYHELEFAFSDFVHLIARAQVGVFNEGMVLGTQARLRIGNERRTNVLLGGELLGEVGASVDTSASRCAAATARAAKSRAASRAEATSCSRSDLTARPRETR